MPRQPNPGASAPAHAPPPAPLPPQAYRALRERYNALLVTLYERSNLTLREIAMLAGRTDRAIGIRVRALRCRPRNARTCRPGTDVGVRRAGKRPPPLKAAAVQRAAEAFAGVAQELAVSAQVRAASETQRSVVRAGRRTARTQLRVIAGAARRLRHVASAIEDAAAIAGVRARARLRPRKPKAPKRPSRDEMRQAQERALRASTERMHAAHGAAPRRGAAAAPQPDESEADRRINAIAERYYRNAERRHRD